MNFRIYPYFRFSFFLLCMINSDYESFTKMKNPGGIPGSFVLVKEILK